MAGVAFPFPCPRIDYWGARHRATQGGCWIGREYLTPDSRRVVVAQLFGTIKEVHPSPSFFSDAELLLMAETLERGFFMTATSYHDYLVKLSMKLLCFEERGRQASVTHIPPTAPSSPRELSTAAPSNSPACASNGSRSAHRKRGHRPTRTCSDYGGPGAAERAEAGEGDLGDFSRLPIPVRPVDPPPVEDNKSHMDVEADDEAFADDDGDDDDVGDDADGEYDETYVHDDEEGDSEAEVESKQRSESDGPDAAGLGSDLPEADSPYVAQGARWDADRRPGRLACASEEGPLGEPPGLGTKRPRGSADSMGQLEGSLGEEGEGERRQRQSGGNRAKRCRREEAGGVERRQEAGSALCGWPAVPA